MDKGNNWKSSQKPKLEQSEQQNKDNGIKLQLKV